MRRTQLVNIDATATGWISFSDVFLLTTVFGLSLVVAFAFGYQKVSREARAGQSYHVFYDECKTQEKALLERIKSLEIAEEIARKEAEVNLTRALAAEASVTGLREELKTAMSRADSLAIDLARQSFLQGKLRQELLGMTGSLGRVVFVFDRSESMNHSVGVANANDSKESRWKAVQRTAETWIRLLPVSEASLVLYNNSLERFPQDGRTLTSISDDMARERFLAPLSQLTPQGNTNTLLALQAAFEYNNIDAIFLFTDGRPTSSPNGTIGQKALMQEIYAFLEKNRARKLPVHVIAFADYFEPDFGNFLNEIARITGGTFVGR